jgi:hypothetical protein
MSTPKLQVGRALAVIPSSTTDIPFPAVGRSGAATGGSGTTLVDAAATFITSQTVKVGDIIYNTSTNNSALVSGVRSETVLETAGGAFAAGNNYVIYQGGNNQGCVLYVGTGGTLNIITADGDSVSLVNVISGQFIPIQVKRVLATSTAADILALW